MKNILLLIFLLLFSGSFEDGVRAQSMDLNQFEDFVIRAKKLGATHISITEDIPPALWQMEENPDDPYPAWFIYQPGIMKIFPPKILQPYMNMEYAKKVQDLFAARCAIIKKYKLKAYYSTNEPHLLPEAFFRDYPLLRGPRVDQVNRSRTPRYAPCVDRPEVLAMYREAMEMLLEKLPEVEIFSFLTSDSGAGLCWSPALYPGKNGPSWCSSRPMKERVAGFLETLKQAAREDGKEIQVNIHGIKPRQWMLPTFNNPQEIAKDLSAGLAVDGFEGPDGDQLVQHHLGGGTWNTFYPVVGIPRPLSSIHSMMAHVAEPNAPLTVTISDAPRLDFDFKLYNVVQQEKPKNTLQMMQTLHDFAAQQAGPQQANDLLDLWLALDKVEAHLNELNFGPVFVMGGILARWINRPMVPYPEKLSAEEKSYWRPYLFQAKGESQANNLIDIQAMRMFEGYGAHMLVQRNIEVTLPEFDKAEAAARRLAKASDHKMADKWKLLGKRIEAARSLARTVDNMVGYQALLTLSKNDGIQIEPNPVLGTQGSWKRQELLRIARNEADNAAELRALLLSTKEPIIHTAPTPEQETIRMLSPELPDQLKKKVEIIMAHWMDYNQLFTRPNL